MMTPTATYDLLARVLSYPGLDYRALVEDCARTIPAECAAPMQAFATFVQPLTLQKLEELFTQTFDLNPVCSLELGWHLFGENYDRGLLLVRARQELDRHGIAETTELPDHLTHVLRLLPRMERERAADFTGACVLPALAKMQDAISKSKSPYEDVLRAVAALIRADFPELEPPTPVAEPVLRVLTGRA